MSKLAAAIAALAVSLTGCASTPKQDPTSLQIQAFQTKEFETQKSTAFAAVISVFQDLGYIIESADKDTGFITAGSPNKTKTGFWEAMAGVSSSGQTRATAFVEEIRPGFATVRLNFVNTKKRSSLYGQDSQVDEPIIQPAPYQVAFEKVDDAIFIRSASKLTQPTN